MDSSPHGLAPRQLESQLAGVVGTKRRTPAQNEQAMAEDVTPAGGLGGAIKRPRPATVTGAGLPPSGGQILPGAAAPATAPPNDTYDDVGEEAGPRPDLFEYFAQRAGRSKEMQREIQRLCQREAALSRRLQDAELSVSRAKAEAAAAIARADVLQSHIDTQRTQSEAALRREVERSSTLEIELKQARTAANLNVTSTQGTATVERTIASQIGGDALVRQLQRQVGILERAVETTKDDADSAVRRLTADLSREQKRLAAEQDMVTLLKGQLAAAEELAMAEGAARRDANARIADLEARMLEMEAGAPTIAGSTRDEGEAVLIRALRERLKVAETAAKDAARLRERAKDAAGLLEKLDAAERRARAAEQLLDREEQVHAELSAAQAELQRWTSVLSGTGGCSTPEDLIRFVRRLQDEQLAAATQKGNIGEDLAAARADADAARAVLRDAETAAEASRARAEAAEAALARAQRRADLLARERDGLRTVLASYDEEYLGAREGIIQESGQLTPAQRRIAELEAVVEELHAHIAALESDLAAGSSAEKTIAEAVTAAESRARAAEAQARAAEAEGAALAKEVAILRERVGRGEFNPETTRVVHLRNNPESELQRAAMSARCAELEAENEALKENFRRMESAQDGAGEAHDAGGGSLRLAQIEGEANLLRRRLAEVQKSSDRLQQVFTRQIGTFRDAIQGLFGYAVEMTSDPTARDYRAHFLLHPQHADEPGAELAFRMLRDGRLVLEPTDYSKRRLAREIEMFIDRFRSIPAFTANLTMENFQRFTQS